MKNINNFFIFLIIGYLLGGCSFFDDAKELARQLEYYKKQVRTLEENVKKLSEVIDTLRGENTRLKIELQKYKEAHSKMLK